MLGESHFPVIKNIAAMLQPRDARHGGAAETESRNLLMKNVASAGERGGMSLWG
jgi:hypothetical protein